MRWLSLTPPRAGSLSNRFTLGWFLVLPLPSLDLSSGLVFPLGLKNSFGRLPEVDFWLLIKFVNAMALVRNFVLYVVLLKTPITFSSTLTLPISNLLSCCTQSWLGVNWALPHLPALLILLNLCLSRWVGYSGLVLQLCLGFFGQLGTSSLLNVFFLTNLLIVFSNFLPFYSSGSLWLNLVTWRRRIAWSLVCELRHLISSAEIGPSRTDFTLTSSNLTG